MSIRILLNQIPRSSSIAPICSETRSMGLSPHWVSVFVVSVRSFRSQTDLAPRSVGTLQLVLRPFSCCRPVEFRRLCWCGSVRLVQVALPLAFLRRLARSSLQSVIPYLRLHVLCSRTLAFFVTVTLAPFSWTISKPWVLCRIFVMFWIASLSRMILFAP